jgi:hypothetical protein
MNAKAQRRSAAKPQPKPWPRRNTKNAKMKFPFLGFFALHPVRISHFVEDFCREQTQAAQRKEVVSAPLVFFCGYHRWLRLGRAAFFCGQKNLRKSR